MTKAADKAAAILVNKKIAFAARVDVLCGHVAARIKISVIEAAFAAGKRADDFAAEIASAEPVGLALFPMKFDAVKEAQNDALDVVEKVRADLEAHGWDMKLAAPYPRCGQDRKAVAKYRLYGALVTSDPTKGYQIDGRVVIMSEDGVARFLKVAGEFAAAQYDAFICKMVAKVGPVIEAAIDGSHVWGHSVLTVKLANGTVERWKTQQIINYSGLGTRFPQWPSRKVK